MQIEVFDPEWGKRKIFWMDGSRGVDSIARQAWVAFRKYHPIPAGMTPFLMKSTGEKLHPEHTLAKALEGYPGLLEIRCARNE